MENNNELVLRQISQLESEAVRGVLHFFEGGIANIVEDQMFDGGNAFVITRKGGAKQLSDAEILGASEPASPELRDIEDIVALGRIWILSTEEEIQEYLGEGVYGEIIPSDGKPVMYIAAFCLPGEVKALGSIWVLALQMGIQLDVSAILTYGSTDYVQEIDGHRLWWPDHSRSGIHYVEEKPAEVSYEIAVEVVPSERFSSALDVLQKQGVPIPLGAEKVLTLFEQ